MEVDLLERLEEAIAHLAVDSRYDFVERATAAVEVLDLRGHELATRTQRLELLHRDRVDRPQVADLLAQLVGAILGDSTVTERLCGKRRLDGHAQFLDDAAHRLVDLDFELTLLDTKVPCRHILAVDLRLHGANGFLRGVNRLAERL